MLKKKMSLVTAEEEEEEEEESGHCRRRRRRRRRRQLWPANDELLWNGSMWGCYGADPMMLHLASHSTQPASKGKHRIHTTKKKASIGFGSS